VEIRKILKDPEPRKTSIDEMKDRIDPEEARRLLEDIKKR